MFHLGTGQTSVNNCSTGRSIVWHVMCEICILLARIQQNGKTKRNNLVLFETTFLLKEIYISAPIKY